MTDEELAAAGFVLTQRRRTERCYARRANPYLVFWLTVAVTGEAELTWEFELGQYLADGGFAFSGQDEVSLLLFPTDELHAPFTSEGVVSMLRAAERRLAAVDLLAGR